MRMFLYIKGRWRSENYVSCARVGEREREIDVKGIMDRKWITAGEVPF